AIEGSELARTRMHEPNALRYKRAIDVAAKVRHDRSQRILVRVPSDAARKADQPTMPSCFASSRVLFELELEARMDERGVACNVQERFADRRACAGGELVQAVAAERELAGQSQRQEGLIE